MREVFKRRIWKPLSKDALTTAPKLSTSSNVSLESSEGYIGFALNNAEVARRFYVEGGLNNIQSNYYFVLATERKNLIWPKIDTGLVTPSVGEWRHYVMEHGGLFKEKFSLLFIRISCEGHCFVENWWRYGYSVGSYPGLKLSDIPGAVELHRVSGLQIRQD